MELKAESEYTSSSLKSFVAYVPFVPFHIIIHSPSAISVFREEDKKRPRLVVGGGEREVGRRIPAGAKSKIFEHV